MKRLYATDQHPSAPGVWVAADLDTSEIVSQFTNGEQGRLRAYNLLASAYDFEALVADGTDLVKWISDPAIAYIGTQTGDKRIIDEGAIQFRSFPQPLMAMLTTSFGHEGAVIAGRVDQASINGNQVVASGVFDSGDTGQDVMRLVSDQMLRGVSLDPGQVEAETEVLEVDEDGWPTDWLDHFTLYEMAGLTITGIPAFADAAIKIDGEIATDSNGDTTEAIAASGILVDPPLAWFEDPGFTEPTPIRVSDDGHIRGHIAVWGVCHIGRTGDCVTPPKGTVSYDKFTTGYVQCNDPAKTEIPTGVYSVGGGHADIRLNAALAKQHYDDSCLAAADVAIGEDDHGVWVSGAVRPEITAATFQALRGSAPSGDWRGPSHAYEFVACLAVNVQGFPQTRTRRVNGEQVALVAAVAPLATAPARPTVESLAREVAQLRRAVGPLMELAADKLAQL